MSSLTPGPQFTPPARKPMPTALFHAVAKPVQSSDLFNGGKTVCIEHCGEIYRLQTTKLGKLILTK